MYDFTQKTGAGEQYHRANKIIFNNPVQAKTNPEERSVIYNIEQVTNSIDGDFSRQDAGWLDASVAIEEERDEVVDLIDLEGNKLGQMNLGELSDKTMLFINSIMIHIAKRQNKLKE